MQHVVFGVLFSLYFFIIPCGGTGTAEEVDTGSSKPVTTEVPEIPVEELELLLKPLAKDQLLIELGAWQSLVQAKAEQIARAEITIMRQNKEIEKAEQVRKEAVEAKQQLEEVKKHAQKVRETGDTAAMAEADEAAKDAKKQMAKVGESVDEAAQAAEKTAEIQAKMRDDIKRTHDETADAAKTAQDAVDNVGKAVDEAKGKTGEALRIAADRAKSATDQAVEATESVSEKASDAAVMTRQAASVEETAASIEDAEAAMGKAQEKKKEEKITLLEKLSELRQERVVLLDQFQAVISALEAKTAPEDGETLAKIRDSKLYASQVSGIHVDIKDVTSTWLAIKTWLLSEEGGQRWGINLMTFIAILVAAWLVSGIFSRLIRQAMKRVPGTSRLLGDFLVRAVKWIVLAVGFMMALASLEVSVSPLLALVGATGFAVAFALQDSLSNFASGLMIMFFKPFDVGHIVEAAGVLGKVDSLNLVSTTIKTFDNRLMLIPNNKVWRDVIMNATAVEERRVDMEFRIGYDDDIDKAHAILEEIVSAHPKVLEKPAPKIRLNTLEESSATFIVRPWVKRAHRLGVKWDITREVKKRFDAEGIGGPYMRRKVQLLLNDADKQALFSQSNADRLDTREQKKESE